MKKGVEKGCDIFNGLKAASINPPKHYGLGLGPLQELDLADFIMVDNLVNLDIFESYINGKHIYNKDFSESSHKTNLKLINNFQCYAKTAKGGLVFADSHTA